MHLLDGGTVRKIWAVCATISFFIHVKLLSVLAWRAWLRHQKEEEEEEASEASEEASEEEEEEEEEEKEQDSSIRRPPTFFLFVCQPD